MSLPVFRRAKVVPSNTCRFCNELSQAMGFALIRLKCLCDDPFEEKAFSMLMSISLRRISPIWDSCLLVGQHFVLSQ